MTRRRAVLSLLTAATSVLISLAIAELAARAYGHRPRIPVIRPEPAIHVDDPVLGWRPVPGRYLFGPYSPAGVPAVVTIRPDGARDTGGGADSGRPLVLLVGCSFTFGWAVSDDETWAWRLQELRPDVEVENRGVGGYGTLQSLLLLEQLLQQGQRPARVLYGFLDHSLRNVAAPGWLLSLASNTQTVATPYCTLAAGGELDCRPPEPYPSLPLHQYLASMALIEREMMVRRAGPRQAMGVKVTTLLVERMAALCHRYGVPFSLVVLQVQERLAARYVSFAKDHGIDVIDCNHPGVSEADIVAGEGHPNVHVHRLWADCIAAALAEPDRLPPH